MTFANLNSRHGGAEHIVQCFGQLAERVTRNSEVAENLVLGKIPREEAETYLLDGPEPVSVMALTLDTIRSLPEDTPLTEQLTAALPTIRQAVTTLESQRDQHCPAALFVSEILEGYAVNMDAPEELRQFARNTLASDFIAKDDFIAYTKEMQPLATWNLLLNGGWVLSLTR